MAKAIDLKGQRFGHLLVLERDFEAQAAHPNERQAWWKCHCDLCGQEKSLRASALKKALSCGCIKGKKANGESFSEEEKQKIKANLQRSPIFQKSNENRRLDLKGQRFDRLLVVSYAPLEKQVFYNGIHKPTWLCKCDCGQECFITTENLRRGSSRSCGCFTKDRLSAQLDDLSGQQFGHLKVIKFLGTINHNSKYLVKCDCGKEYETFRSNLIQGRATSCGCIKKSKGEQKIRQLLLKHNIAFEVQKSFPDLIYKKKLKYDFFLPAYNIAIEYDGEQHFHEIKGWGGQQDFLERQQRDDHKNNYAKEKQITLIRIPYYHYDKIVIEDLLPNSKFIINKGE